MSATSKTFLNNNPPSVEDDDLNGFKLENNNLIVGAGITLDSADHQQTHEAVSHYAGGGDYYTDSGAADAYVLDVIGSQKSPPSYFAGMRIRYIPGNANTGPSTVNVATLGVLNLTINGTKALTANMLLPNQPTEFVHNGTNFQFADPFSVFRGATLVTTSATAITAPIDIVWESALIDSDGASDIGGANPERITIPVGITRARVSMSPIITGTATSAIYMNGSTFVGMTYDSEIGIATHNSVSTAWLPVVSGDYFTAQVISSSGAQVQTGSWFTVEFK